MWVLTFVSPPPAGSCDQIKRRVFAGWGEVGVVCVLVLVPICSSFRLVLGFGGGAPVAYARVLGKNNMVFLRTWSLLEFVKYLLLGREVVEGAAGATVGARR